MNIENELNELSNDLNKHISADLRLAIFSRDDTQPRAALFVFLASNLNPLNNVSLYNAVRDYLSLEIFDHKALSNDEVTIARKIPELDESEIIQIEVNAALIKRYLNDETLSEDEIRALTLVLQDRFIDGETMTDDEQSALTRLSKDSAIEVETPLIDDKKISLITFGYDIYDLDAVKDCLLKNKEMSEREIHLIKRIHGFDPTATEAF